MVAGPSSVVTTQKLVNSEEFQVLTGGRSVLVLIASYVGVRLFAVSLDIWTIVSEVFSNTNIL